MNEFNAWLTANGFDPETVTTAQKPKLQAAWRAETTPAPRTDPPTPPVKVESTSFDAKMQAIEEENSRIEYIRTATVAMCERNVGNPEKCKQLREMCAAAVEDKKTDTRAFDLALLRADRNAGPVIMSGSTPQMTDVVIEAAVCKTGGLENIEKHYDERTLSAADKHFKHGLGLQDLVGHYARQGGFRGASIKTALNGPDVLRCAFSAQPNGQPALYAGTTGPSTYSLPNILGAISNKFLRVGFEAVDQTWREFSSRRSVSDFKAITTAMLTGGFVYEPLAPSGEIQHADVGEKTYTNQAFTQAKMFGISRESLINDDLGALTGVSRRLGRGAALRLNQMVFTAFLANTGFFTAGNNNVITGGTSVLSGSTGLEALRLAYEKFNLQTDPDGQPIGIRPTILLVPTALEVSAKNLMNSTTVVGTTTANSMMPDQNSFAGMFRVVSTPYLQNTTFSGSSTTAWYLLADPNEMPTVEVVFLNGKEEPTVETAEADFNQLGIALRGFFDAGAALQEFRGGVRAAGA